MLVDEHSLGRGSSSGVSFKGQLASTIRLRYSFDASENRLSAGKIDEPIFEERLRFRCWVGGGIYFQSKAAYGLIDWHKLFSFCWRDFNDYRIKSSIEESRFLLEAFPPAFDRRCTLNHLSKARMFVDPRRCDGSVPCDMTSGLRTSHG